jgi:hypothetical protein
MGAPKRLHFFGIRPLEYEKVFVVSYYDNTVKPLIIIFSIDRFSFVVPVTVNATVKIKRNFVSCSVCSSSKSVNL